MSWLHLNHCHHQHIVVLLLMSLLCLYSRIILFNYVAQTGKECGLTAAMAISIAWNCFASAHSLEQPINALIFNKMLADELKQSVIKYDAMDYKNCYKSLSSYFIIMLCRFCQYISVQLFLPTLHHTYLTPFLFWNYVPLNVPVFALLNP